jgi:uncharacterized protein YegJ (DUF2314 family)
LERAQMTRLWLNLAYTSGLHLGPSAQSNCRSVDQSPRGPDMAQAEEPLFMAVDAESDAYLQTIAQAHASLAGFKQALQALPEADLACVKFFVPESPDASEGAYLWLMQPEFSEGFCYAKPFELPENFSWIQVGQWLKFSEDSLLDWYLLSESGEMRGGFSLRYQREQLPEDQRAAFDARIGVRQYL